MSDTTNTPEDAKPSKIINKDILPKFILPEENVKLYGKVLQVELELGAFCKEVEKLKHKNVDWLEDAWKRFRSSCDYLRRAINKPIPANEPAKPKRATKAKKNNVEPIKKRKK